MRRMLLVIIMATKVLTGSAVPAFSAAILLVNENGGENVIVEPPTPTTAYIVALNLTGPITGAEVRLTGMPESWQVVTTPLPPANISIGDPFGEGANIAFPTCQSPVGLVVRLWQVTIIPDVYHGDVAIGSFPRVPPTNPGFNCPLLVTCDYSLQCTTSPGYTCINGGGYCLVSVEAKTWSALKALFR